MKTPTIHAGIVLLLLFSANLKAQDSLSKRVNQSPGQHQRSTPNQPSASYQTQIPGWTLRPGDTLQMGRGSRSDKAFAFLYQPDTLAAGSSVPANRRFLRAENAGQKMILKELNTANSDATVSGLCELVASSGPKPFYVAVNKAIDAGEILPPSQYRPSAQASPSLPVVGAQQLINLKALLDAGKINRADYERRRKKLLQKQ